MVEKNIQLSRENNVGINLYVEEVGTRLKRLRIVFVIEAYTSCGHATPKTRSPPSSLGNINYMSPIYP